MKAMQKGGGRHPSLLEKEPVRYLWRTPSHPPTRFEMHLHPVVMTTKVVHNNPEE
jgi:hypothetical protein